MSIHLGKKSNSFTHKRAFFSAWQWWIKNLLQIYRGTNLGLKSQQKFIRHNGECLVNFSNQNSHGVRYSKSQTKSEQKWFTENKTSWLFFLASYFGELSMDLPPYLGPNNIWKYLYEFSPRFERQIRPISFAINFVFIIVMVERDVRLYMWNCVIFFLTEYSFVWPEICRILSQILLRLTSTISPPWTATNDANHRQHNPSPPQQPPPPSPPSIHTLSYQPLLF